MTEKIRVLGRVATVNGARVLVVQRGDTAATLKWFPGAALRAGALAEADLRTRVHVPGFGACAGLIDLEGGLALLLAAPPLTGVPTRLRAGPVPARAALELVASIGEILLALDEAGADGGMVLPVDVASGGGRVQLLGLGSGPRSDEPGDARSLSWRMGGLLYALVAGEPFPARAGLPFARDLAVGRRLAARGVAPELVGLTRRLVTGPTVERPWPEEAIVLARALAVALDGPGLAEWSAEELPALRDPLVGRVISAEPPTPAVVPRPPDARATVEILFDDVATPEEEPSTDLMEPIAAPVTTPAPWPDEVVDDETTPADAYAPNAMMRALDEETQPFEPMDAIDDSGILEEPAAPANEPPTTRRRLWSLLGLR